MNRNGSPFAALQVIVVITIIFIAFYVVMSPYAQLYNKFMTNDSYVTDYTTYEECQNAHGYWENNVCHELPARAKSQISFQRKIWLTAPWVLIIGLIVWYFTILLKKDTSRYQL